MLFERKAQKARRRTGSTAMSLERFAAKKHSFEPKLYSWMSF